MLLWQEKRLSAEAQKIEDRAASRVQAEQRLLKTLFGHSKPSLTQVLEDYIFELQKKNLSLKKKLRSTKK